MANIDYDDEPTEVCLPAMDCDDEHAEFCLPAFYCDDESTKFRLPAIESNDCDDEPTEFCLPATDAGPGFRKADTANDDVSCPADVSHHVVSCPADDVANEVSCPADGACPANDAASCHADEISCPVDEVSRRAIGVSCPANEVSWHANEVSRPAIVVSCPANDDVSCAADEVSCPAVGACPANGVSCPADEADVSCPVDDAACSSFLFPPYNRKLYSFRRTARKSMIYCPSVDDLDDMYETICTFSSTKKCCPIKFDVVLSCMGWPRGHDNKHPMANKHRLACTIKDLAKLGRVTYDVIDKTVSMTD